MEELDWLGGQLTAQGIPLDELPWNETVIFSRTYTEFRNRIRQYYRDHYPLTAEARANPLLNPGMGNVSTIAHEPRVSVQVIAAMLSPYVGAGTLRVLQRHKVLSVVSHGDRISGLIAINLNSGREIAITCGTIIDATETGDILELGKVEHVLGAEAQSDTGEPHALTTADPLNQPGVTWAFAADYLPGELHVIEKPASYTRWRDGILAPWTSSRFTWTIPDHITHELRQRSLFAGDTDEEYVFDLWHARRIAYRRNFQAGAYPSDITLACWPQIEYWDKPVLGVSDADFELAHREESRAEPFVLPLDAKSEAPRHDGGQGYPGPRLRGDVLGTDDGLAKQVYYREGRRNKGRIYATRAAYRGRSAQGLHARRALCRS